MRTIRVSRVFRGERALPFVRLSGDWLGSLGFRLGSEVAVTGAPGRIVLDLAVAAHEKASTVDPFAWELAPLRETALLYAGNPQEVAALRKAGAAFYARLLDLSRGFDGPGPSTLDELAAVAADLKYLRRFMMETVGGEMTGAGTRYETTLAASARGRWAPIVGKVAEQIEQALRAQEICRWAAAAVRSNWWAKR